MNPGTKKMYGIDDFVAGPQSTNGMKYRKCTVTGAKVTVKCVPIENQSGLVDDI